MKVSTEEQLLAYAYSLVSRHVDPNKRTPGVAAWEAWLTDYAAYQKQKTHETKQLELWNGVPERRQLEIRNQTGETLDVSVLEDTTTGKDTLTVKKHV